MNVYSTVIPMKQMTYSPIFEKLIKGDGITLIDENGKKYLDGISCLWNSSLGYNYKPINDAIKKQLEQLVYTNLNCFTTKPLCDYSEKLINYFDKKFLKVLYTCSGSESVEASIKIARRYQNIKGKKDKKIIGAFDFSYHGTTYAAMSVSGIDKELILDYHPIVNGVEWIKTPFDTYNDLNSWNKNFDQFFEVNKDKLAAVILEPVIASGGIIPIPKETIKHIKECCEMNDTLLIFDEVATGFGKTGSMFALEEVDVIPDLLCLSKGINNGVLPMGVVLLNEKVINEYIKKKEIIEHFSTQNGNPLSCAAAIQMFDELRNKEYLLQVKEKGLYFKQKLELQLHPNNVIVDIRQCGLMIGVDLKKQSNLQVISEESIVTCLNNLLKKGIIVYAFYTERKNSGFSFFPSFNISYKEMDELIQKFVSVLNKTIF